MLNDKIEPLESRRAQFEVRKESLYDLLSTLKGGEVAKQLVISIELDECARGIEALDEQIDAEIRKHLNKKHKTDIF